MNNMFIFQEEKARLLSIKFLKLFRLFLCQFFRTKDDLFLLPILKKFITIKGIEYLAIDAQFIVKSMSVGLPNYSDYPEKLQIGSYAGDAFPELIGLEEICEKLILEECSSFEMKWIARSVNPQRPKYINFYIFANNSKKLMPGSGIKQKNLFVFFEAAELLTIQE